MKLLRVMQEREVRPVGSTQSYKVDIRVIAATNRHLPDQVKRGTFREDLYYRIAVVTLEVPPLRERGDDIPLLAQGFLERMRGDSPVRRIEEEAMKRLLDHGWPGNVRELENVIHRAIILSRGPGLIAEDLPPSLNHAPAATRPLKGLVTWRRRGPCRGTAWRPTSAPPS